MAKPVDKTKAAIRARKVASGVRKVEKAKSSPLMSTLRQMSQPYPGTEKMRAQEGLVKGGMFKTNRKK